MPGSSCQAASAAAVAPAPDTDSSTAASEAACSKTGYSCDSSTRKWRWGTRLAGRERKPCSEGVWRACMDMNE
jgi:hypothetical protein